MYPNAYKLTPSPDHRGGDRIREVDGWRAVSVLLVILHHVGGYQHNRLVAKFSSLNHVIRSCGPLGVKVFFVISGFVICRLFISEEHKYGSISLRAFYCRRIFRILPPFYVYMSVLLILLANGLIDEHFRGILGGGLFLRDIHLKSLETVWFAGHTWSLAVEEQFYLIFPVIWKLTPQTQRARVFFILFLACAAWNLSMAYTGFESVIPTSTRGGFACIVAGVLMAVYEAQVRTAVCAVPAAVVSLAGLCLLIQPVYPDTWQAALYEGMLMPVTICLVLGFSLVRGAQLKACLVSKPLQALGLTSYGIYLWQQLFTAPAVYFTGRGRLIPLFWPLICLVVPLSYFLIEKPVIRYGRLLSQRGAKAPSWAAVSG
jgi:peptidoglycan/LPS O-acetylase OafA/YrhL